METNAVTTFSKNNSFLISTSNIITDVGNDFLELTGYSKDELVNKYISEVFTNMLRLSYNLLEQIDINYKTESFLFTKFLYARCVYIQKVVYSENGEIKFLINEVPNSRFENKNLYLEQLYKSEFVAIAVYSIPDMVLVKANQKYLDFLESPFNKTSDSIGRRIEQIITGWKGSPVEQYWKEAIDTHNAVQVKEYEHIGYNRGITYWDSIITPIIEDGKVKYVVSNTSEVTEKVINRRKIQEQMDINNLEKKQLEAIVMNISDALLVYKKNEDVHLLNDTARKVFYEPENYRRIGDSTNTTKYFDIYTNEITKQDLPALKSLRGECISNYIMYAERPDRRIYYSVSSCPVYDRHGDIEYAVTCMHDITELIEKENEIKKQKERLEVILKSMSDGMELVDNKLKITYLNQSAKDFYYNPGAKVMAGDSLKYNKYYYGIDGEEISKEDLPAFRVFNKGSFQNYILTICRPDKRIYASINGSQICDNNGYIIEAILCIRDISEQVKQEKVVKYHQEIALKAEMEKYEALLKAIEMKDEFLSLISHEFKTPITVINSAIQAMEFICKDELSHKAKGYLKKIRQNSLRQLRLVNNLLEITRISSGHFKLNKNNHDIIFITKDIVKSIYLYTQQKGIHLTVSSKLEKKVIGLDEEKYERILLNLLSNAIKFTPKSKRILVTISSRKGFVCIKVKDEGIGIPKDKLKVIFERFGQVDSSLSRQAEGTGIGLSLVKMLVESMGGSVSVKSKEGIGCTFTVLLPNVKTAENFEEKNLEALSDNRLIQATAIEFSDIYL